MNSILCISPLSPECHGVDPALFSLNWFLCLFVEYLPVNTYLHIWDAFLFEGSKVDTERYFYQKHIEVSNPKKWVGLVNSLSMYLLISTIYSI